MTSIEARGTGADRHRPRLRTGFVLVVLLAVVVPMGVVGLWLVQATQRSGEALVRARLAETLEETVLSVARAWERERAGLVRLIQSEAVQAALLEGARMTETAEPAAAEGSSEGSVVPVRGPVAGSSVPSTGWETEWEALAGSVPRIVFRSMEGEVREVLEREPPALRGPGPVPGGALLPVRLDVHEPWSGERIGVAEAWVRADALLPGDLILPGVSGAVLGVFEPASGAPLLPLALEPDLFQGSRFEWGGERWVVVHQRLHEPPVLLALAGPTAAVAAPLQEAARGGLAALLLVTFAGVLLTVVLSRRLTRSLGGLAEAADAVAAGRLDRRVPEEGPDEVHRLSRAFNAMTANLRRTLEQLSQHEALAAMGEMAASLAHEVRNPLTAIQVDLDRARKRLARGEEGADALLQRVALQIERLDASVSDALSLARGGTLVKGPVELDLTLRAAAEAAAPRFESRQARLELPEKTGRGVRVRGDAAVLERLFLNLLLNAADALSPEGRAGVRVEPGREVVRVSVWDEGAGMTPEVRDRVLEPFFSTKPRGTGLGLPIAHRIARSHGGELELESEPGRGTTVTVLLPAYRSRA